jgi:hypothetical protein
MAINRFTNVQVLCEPGQEINEDSYSVSDQYLLALDGATGLYEQHVTKELSDARWLALRGAEEISSRLAESPASMPEICLEAALTLQGEFTALATPSLPKTAYPSSGVAALRLYGDTLEYYGLGDLTTLLRHRDGKVEVLHDNHLSRLDHSVLAEMVRMARESGETVAAQRNKVQNLLQRNRDLRNRIDGYMIFDLSAEGAARGTSLRWPAKEICSVAILSDGIADAVPIFGMAPDYNVFLSRLEQKGPRTVYAALRRLQQGDPTFDQYPRFKQADDVTIILANLE